MRSILSLGLLLWGCADDKGESEIPPLNPSDAEDCGDTAPSVDELTCENTGIMEYAETGELVPTLTIWASVSDADGDLTSYISQLFWDEGTVTVDSESLGPYYGTLDGEGCDLFSANLGSRIYLRGGEPLYDTSYEWGFQVTDAGENTSELFTIDCVTPSEDGSGDP